jgi:hypothetical protein
MAGGAALKAKIFPIAKTPATGAVPKYIFRTGSHSFRLAVRTAVSATPIGDLLSAKSGVVLERIARGGGATNWYYCPKKSSLEVVESKFSPGSIVSFYFDDRIRDDV